VAGDRAGAERFLALYTLPPIVGQESSGDDLGLSVAGEH